ncbi:hypothetical protein SLA2020_227280 [Shorea laevis]
MARVRTLVDLLLFYSQERTLFDRMVSSMGKTSHQVKRAIALWLTLEEIGYHDLIRTIHSLNDHTVNALFNETLKCFDCLPLNAAPPVESPDDFSAFLEFFIEPMNYRFFYYNHEFIFRRLQHIVQTVSEKIFGETAPLEVHNSGLRPAVRTLGSTASGKPSQEPKQSTLNPHAEDFYPGQASKDARTMFQTFSKGFPLSREEIFVFFTSN